MPIPSDVQIPSSAWTDVGAGLDATQRQQLISAYDQLQTQLQQVRLQAAEKAADKKAKPMEVYALQMQAAALQAQVSDILRVMPTVLYESQAGQQSQAQAWAERIVSGELTPTQAVAQMNAQRNATYSTGQATPLSGILGTGTSTATLFDEYAAQLGRELTDEEKAYLTAQTLGTPTPYETQQSAQTNALNWAQLNNSQQYQQQQMDLQRQELAASIADAAASRRLAAQQAAGKWALPTGQQYGPGYEPGGAMSQLFSRGGLTYTPQTVPRVTLPTT